MAKWDKINSRGSVHDRRGASRFIGIGGGTGIVGVIVVLAMSYFMGGEVDLNQVLNQLQTAQQQNTSQVQPEEFRGEDDYEVFVSTVLGSTNDTWSIIFDGSDKVYEEPKLVLFRDATNSGCGVATAQVGPHYCPADSTIYIDETFFEVLVNQFGAEGGDVAQAYVIAHEVGHHVQNELGILAESQKSQEAAIRAELQADCFAGVWAYTLKGQGIFEPGEFDEAIDAAEAVGDDRIQEKTTGRVSPEDWTHGSSEQRKYWLNVGYETGDPSQCSP